MNHLMKVQSYYPTLTSIRNDPVLDFANLPLYPHLKNFYI